MKLDMLPEQYANCITQRQKVYLKAYTEDSVDIILLSSPEAACEGEWVNYLLDLIENCGLMSQNALSPPERSNWSFTLECGV